jgi:hypothetical protein
LKPCVHYFLLPAPCFLLPLSDAGLKKATPRHRLFGHRRAGRSDIKRINGNEADHISVIAAAPFSSVKHVKKIPLGWVPATHLSTRRDPNLGRDP